MSKDAMTADSYNILYMPVITIPWKDTKIKVYGPDGVYIESQSLPAYRGSVRFIPCFTSKEEAEAFLMEEGFEDQEVEILELSLNEVEEVKK
jgi:hypothetical protein